MRKLLGALAVAGLVMIAAAPGAEAATCWWNGFTWVCRTPSYAGYWGHHHWRDAWRYRHWRAAHDWRYRHWRAARHWRHHHWPYDRPYAWYR